MCLCVFLHICVVFLHQQNTFECSCILVLSIGTNLTPYPIQQKYTIWLVFVRKSNYSFTIFRAFEAKKMISLSLNIFQGDFWVLIYVILKKNLIVMFFLLTRYDYNSIIIMLKNILCEKKKCWRISLNNDLGSKRFNRFFFFESFKTKIDFFEEKIFNKLKV